MNPKLFLPTGYYCWAALDFSPPALRKRLGKVLEVSPRFLRNRAPVLPFDDFRFEGSVGRTVADSDPPEFPQPAATKGAREHRIHSDR